MRIWRATSDDADDVVRLLAGFRDHMGRTEPTDASLRDSVARLIGRDYTEFLLGAPADGPAGGVVQVRYRWGVWWSAEDCWIEDVFVDPSARRGGLGRALVQAALERAEARGCRRVDLDVDDDNVPAQALYGSLGFERRPQLLLRRSL
jgi:ribosomal protein S18 acetylase RimI-like enzyme